MANGHCRMHGGASTGPRTAEGLERCRLSNFKHGLRSFTVIAERREARTLIRTLRALIAMAGDTR